MEIKMTLNEKVQQLTIEILKKKGAIISSSEQIIQAQNGVNNFNVDETVKCWSFSDSAYNYLMEIIEYSSPDYFSRWDIIGAYEAWKKEFIM
jgi:hypothetical protein